MFDSDLLVVRRIHGGGGEVRLVVQGEIDMASAPGLEAALVAADASSKGAIVVDLAGVSFMDSSGLHVLLRAAQRARASGRLLSIAGAPKGVRRLLQITGTTSLLERSDEIAILQTMP